MKEYTTDVRTKNIQQYGLEILSVFHKICEDHQLTYILDFGTLLGAVRHKGFIPWDDDIDIAMPRKDFEDFKKIAIKTLPENMFLQTHQTDPNYYNYIAKVRIPNKRYTENAMQYFNITHGPWFDIFIYDHKFDNKEKERMKQRRYNKYRNFYPQMMELLVAQPAAHSNFFKILFKKIFRSFLKRSQAKKKRGLFMKYLDAKYAKLDALIKNAPAKNKSGDMITYTFPIRSKSDEKGLLLNRKHFQNRKLQQFEDQFFYIPVDYDEVLTHRYGEYEQLPPIAERKSNHQWV